MISSSNRKPNPKKILSILGLVITAGLIAPLAVGCGSNSESTSKTVSAGDCPTFPIKVVVSVDQWGDIVRELAGDCAKVTTVITSSEVDPHDYEPSSGDTAKFSDAQLVVVNGMDYDPWANKIVSTLNPQPPVLDAGQIAGLSEGQNPHVWYGPEYVFAVADAVTAELSRLSPEGASYFAAKSDAWSASMQPYRDEIASIQAEFGGAGYAATESVFDYMAQALGLIDKTPKGFAAAASNETDPAPGDIAAFNDLLAKQGADVLIYNIQTEGAIPEQIRSTAQKASLPVVEVTESIPAGDTSFQQWQVAQLEALSAALETKK